MNKDKLKEKAFKARKRKEDLQKKITEAENAIKKLEELKTKRESDIENKKTALSKIDDERELLIKLAGLRNELPNHRSSSATKAFFDLLNKFDERPSQDGITFSEKYNSLQNTKLVVKLFFECTKYYPDSDNIRIDGNSFRRKIDDLYNRRERLIEEAKEKLDLEWEKVLNNPQEKNDEPGADSVKVSQETFQENQ